MTDRSPEPRQPGSPGRPTTDTGPETTGSLGASTGSDRSSPGGPVSLDAAGRLSSLWERGGTPDLDAFLAEASPLDPAALVAVLRVDQREHWLAGRRPSAESYLARHPALRGDPEAAVDLVYGEFLLRERLGERPEATEYLGRFPEYTAVLGPQIELHRAMAGTNPSEPGATPASASTTGPAGILPGSADPAAPAAGTLLADRYLVGEEIGRGGMGTVYRAEQLRPVRRPVAVKLVNPGMDSRQVLARFEAERQALAVMDHPHIAKVLDAGATPDGRPFFVMELVAGVPLTDYCDARRLPVAGRLELFRQVCAAVQHAHQKGVIHRDLKPSNVLVEEHDGAPSPKVIDFGLAKAVAGDALTERTLFTAPGAVAGTPLYMAPEQAGPDARDVDTRADVYALGAVLYELLTGSPPIGREALRKAALHEVLRVIREDDPPPPSSRLGSSPDLPTVAANRATEPARLGRLIRGDLDWVVMKALEKDRGRRYESAAALAAEVERFLNHEPVAAGPPTLRYRAGKFVRRNRAAVVAAALVLLSLVAGVVGTTWGMVEARRQRDEAAANLAYAKKGNRILGSIFAGLDPQKIADSGRPLQDVLRENLRTAVRDLEGAAIGDPITLAEMQDTLGTSLVGLGEYALATALYEKAAATHAARLGPTHPASLRSRNSLAEAHRFAGRLDLAVPLSERTLAEMQTTLGPDHPDTIACMTNLANAYHDAARFGDAASLLERALAVCEVRFGPDHLDTLAKRSQLALEYLELGRIGDAEPILDRVLAARRAKLGADHPSTLRSLDDLARAYAAAGRLKEAIPLLEESLRLIRNRLGPDHPDTLISMNNLAGDYQQLGQIDKALPLHEGALRLMKIKLGPDHPTTLFAHANLAQDYIQLEQYDRGLPLLEEALALRKAKSGPDHVETLGTMNLLANAYRDTGQLAKAIPLYEEAIRLGEKRHGRTHYYIQGAIANLGVAYLLAGRAADAVPLLEETDRASRTTPNLRSFRDYLLDGYMRTGRQDEALKLVPQVVTQAREEFPAGSPALAAPLAKCSSILLRFGRLAEAEPLAREAVAAMEKAQPDSWTTFYSTTLLGRALLGQRKYAEAEPLLLRGYEGMKRRESAIPPVARDRLPEAVDRLIELYEALGRPDEATRWRAERAKYPPPPGPPAR